jgi:hypothetical protein
MEHEQPDIYVSIAASMDDNIVQPLADTLTHPRLSLRTEPRAGGDFYAGVELLMATGAVVYLAKSYFDGFLKQAGRTTTSCSSAASAHSGRDSSGRIALCGRRFPRIRRRTTPKSK